MYRVTMQLSPTEHVSLRVANQDLARVMTLAARLELLNPGFHVTSTREDDIAVRAAGAA